ncbi:hypothetical protein PZA20_00860 [Pectobacterium polaris]|uniref:hypothetical protein n=1 Tax=Pectobacterium polaris TaxID=2042057 RepID=UPI0023B1F88B|nr:hypothetical protein [Pectobacterium polaris]MDE8740380.1 hypothetical protein [Pectobacterium polaris]
MSKFTASNIYITRYTCSSLSIGSKYDDIVLITQKLTDVILEYANSKNIHVQCAKDFLEYKPHDDSMSLEEIIFEIAKDDLSFFSHYLSMFEIAISSVLSNIPSSAYEKSLTEPRGNTFPLNYSLTIDDILWPGKSESMHTKNWKDTLKKNSFFIAQNNKNKDDFIKLSEKNYDNLVFHKDIVNTLDTIIKGTYKDYVFIISDSLNALNQCYHFISKDPNKNQEDLNLISAYTANIGKQLACTRQGSKKPMFDFPINDSKGAKSESINCEYHLKINWNDSGKRLESTKLVRVYFALKYDDILERKSIKVAYIGRHWS